MISEERNRLLDKEFSILNDFEPPSYEEWKALVENDLKGASFDKKLVTKTYENIDLQPIYTEPDFQKLIIINSLPGFDNLVRGNKIEGYFKNSWSINQEINIADAEKFNSTLLKAIQNGQNCVNLSFDSATISGIDADYAKPEFVGDFGLSISGIKSIGRALKNVDLENLPIYIEAGFNSLPILSLIFAYVKSENINIHKIKGKITSDPYAYLVKNGELNISLDFIFSSMKTAVEWTINNCPNLKSIEINTTHYRNCGANIVQELAYSISTLVEYVNAMIDKNTRIEDVFRSISFTFGIGPNYFLEIAKFRAARLLIKNIADAYGISEKIDINISAKTINYNQTKLDPYVNLLRATTESFSAILGGVESITTSPFDETIRKPDEFSRRIAKNTQIILKEESHLNQVIDAAGGSYFIESITEDLAKKAWELFQQIENDGGLLNLLKSGTIQKSIEEVHTKHKNDINKRKAVIVGTNMFADLKQKPLETKPFDHISFQKKRAEYLQKYRLNGTHKSHQQLLEKLNSIHLSASSEVIELMIEAYLKGATLGEINNSLTASKKEKIIIQKLVAKRASEDFEELRNLSLDYKNKNGYLPKIFLATMGTLKDYKVRADFSTGYFEIGGFDVIYPNGFANAEDAVNSAINSNAIAIVICSTDDNYPKFVPEICKFMKQKKSNMKIILAGYPKDQIEEYKKSGVDDFIYLGADVLKTLTSLMNNIGGEK